MKRLLFRTIIVFAAFFTFGHVSAQTTDKGFFMFKMGQWQKAKNLFDASLMANKSDANAYYGMGEYYMAIKSNDSAAINFNAGIAANPGFALNYVGRAKTFLAVGNTIEATKNLDLAHKVGKKNAEVNSAIARAYVNAGNGYVESAKAELVLAKKIDTKLSSIYLVEGLIEYQKGDYGTAASKFDVAIYYDSLNIEAYLLKAKIYGSVAVKQSAIDILNTLIQKVPECYVAYRELGNVYYEMGKYNDAKTAFDTYFALADYTTEEKERYAYTLFFVKNYDLALQTVNELSHNNPDNYIFLRLISYMSFETGDFAKGVESFQKFFKTIPENKTILMDYEYYGKTLGALSMDSLAIQAYIQAHQKDTNKVQLLDEIGKLYLKQKKYEEAITYYTKSLNKKQTPLPLDFFQIGRSFYLLANSYITNGDSVLIDTLAFNYAAHNADTMFSRVCLLTSNSYLGYIWRARTQSLLDPESESGLAKPYYEQTLPLLLLNPTKYSKEIIEVYSYLGYYYYVANDKASSKEYWAKILEIDPNNEKAKAAIADLSSL
ncbi:MAG: hypothetical protein M0P66_16500 [Salinivirgaceae bacterium]|nr:hypothetical protein [Salinivirgaceae bacterium]